MQIEFTIVILFFVSALLYSSVGHAGASGYLAAMAILNFPPDRMKPTALVLNIIVSLIASVQFYRLKYFSKKIFFSFAISSIPFAFLGGSIHVSTGIYKQIIGVVLILSAIKILYDTFYQSKKYKDFLNHNLEKKNEQTPEYKPVDKNKLNTWQMVLLGAIIGFISGVAGVGGGIFLSPILMFTHADTLKKISGTSALFILVNSISALVANTSNLKILDSQTGYYCVAVILGGFLGSFLGSKKLRDSLLRKILAVVLLIAGIKMFL